MTEAQHHRLFSPSASERWLTCTASPMLIAEAEANMSEEERRDATEDNTLGTLAHFVFADWLLHEDRTGFEEHGTPRYQLGLRVEVDGFTHEVDADMLHHVARAVEWVEELGPGVTLVEQRVRVTICDENGEVIEEVWGTTDVLHQAHHEPDVLHCLDLKYGKGVQVFAAHNTQAMIYAAGSIETHGFVFEDVTTVTVHILQPRIDHNDAWSLTVGELTTWADEDMASAVLEAKGVTGSPTFAPSVDACRWCRVAPCEAARAKVIEAFDDLPPDDPLKTDDEVVEHMTDASLGAFLDESEFFELVIRRARARAMGEILSHMPVPGWKVVEGKSNRTWSDPDAALMLAEVLIDDLYHPPVAKSLAQIEKDMGRKAFTESPLAALVHKPRGAPVLVPESDPRPAFDPEATVLDNFENLDEEEEGT